MAAICSNDGLQAAVKGRTCMLDIVLRHGVPLLIHRSLVGLDIGLTNFAGLGLNVPPDTVVQGVQV